MTLAADQLATLSGPLPRLMPEQLELVRQLVSRHYGFWLKDDWMEQAAARVAARMSAHSLADFHGYLRLLQSDSAPTAEMQELMESLLNHETQFNRNPEQLDLFKHEALMNWRHDLPKRPRRIASLGCSTGEEAYSLAILVDQVMGERADDVLILGLDLSRRALEAARRATYSDFRLRDVPAANRSKYFQSTPDGWQVIPRLQQRVRFLQHNLLLPMPANCLDAIFCCNVLIYFPTPTVHNMLRQFHAVLKPQGYLFLGHADSSVPWPDLFQPCSAGGATCYVRQPASEMKNFQP